VGAPPVVAVESPFGDVTNRTAAIDTDFVVNNLNPIGVRLGGTTVDYGVSVNDVAIDSGTEEVLDVDTGNSTLSFTTRIQNTSIPA